MIERGITAPQIIPPSIKSEAQIGGYEPALRLRPEALPVKELAHSRVPKKFSQSALS